MILMVFTVIIMLAVGAAQYRNGLFSSFVVLFMVLISGLVAFAFWEPIADVLDPIFQGNMLVGSEDLIVLILLFSLTLFVLRLATNYLNQDMIDEHGAVQHFGAMAVGTVAGYFVAGFLLCAVQTLPLDERFLDYQPRTSNETGLRSVFPPDRVWLAFMRYVSAHSLVWKEDPNPAGDSVVDRYVTFDREATFELRYLRYRRGTDVRAPMPYFNEFDRELGRAAKK